MSKKSPAHDPNWQPPTPEERAQMLEAARNRNDPVARALRMKPWTKAGMDMEEYGHLMAFCAANPLLVEKLIIKAGLAIEQKRAEEQDAPGQS